MRSPSPRYRRSSPDRNRSHRISPARYKRARSRSRSPLRRNLGPRARRSPSPRARRSPSPKPRRRSSPGPRHRSRSKSRKFRSRSPKFRSRSPRQRSISSRTRSPRRKSPNVRGGRQKSKSRSRERFIPKQPPKPDKDDGRRRFDDPAPSRNRDRGNYNSPSEQDNNAVSNQPRPLPVSSKDNKLLQSRSDFDPYSDNSGGRGDKDYRTLPPPRISSPGPSTHIIPPTRTRERFDQTEISITGRFAVIAGHVPQFTPTENITIGIERNIPGNEPAIIRREIMPAEVVISRRKDEGSKPLYKRHEFLGPKEEYVERRTIKVQPSEDRHKSNRPMLTDRWTVRQDEDPRLGMGKRHGMTREELDSYILEQPSVTEPQRSLFHEDSGTGRYTASKASDVGSRSRPSASHIEVERNTRDERVVLPRGDDMDSYRFTVNIGNSPTRTQDFSYRENREKDRFERDPNDLRHNLTRKKSTTDKDDAFDARQKLLKKRENEIRKREEELKRKSAQLEKKERFMYDKKEERPDFANRPGRKDELPDFSNRPGKYQYEEWKDHPEKIPKGLNYYEVKNNPKIYATKQTKPQAYATNQIVTHKIRDKPIQARKLPQRKEDSLSVASEKHNQHDNRESSESWDRGSRGFRGRGRGRGFSDFRGRGSVRGRFPAARGFGRGGRRGSSPIGREWKHDKYQEADDDREEKPSSTTKN